MFDPILSCLPVFSWYYYPTFPAINQLMAPGSRSGWQVGGVRSSTCPAPLRSDSQEHIISIITAEGAPLCLSRLEQTARWSQRKKKRTLLPRLQYTLGARELHNRVTGEIKRTALLQGSARSSPLTHILSGCNEEWLLTTWLEPHQHHAHSKLAPTAFLSSRL